ncbi:hypothetical protein WOLCODRAFT_59049, partial [Wolfiporia cocos MD-104 SS10]
ITTCVLFFIAFLLYLLVALSLPIIKSIYLFSIHFNEEDGDVESAVATELRFGVWGLCAILDIIGHQSLIDTVIEWLTVLFVLHPVCAILAFAVMFTSLFLESHGMCILSLVISVLTIILGCLVFAADIALVVVGRIRISALEAFSYTVGWGPAVWIILVAVICLWAGMV